MHIVSLQPPIHDFYTTFHRLSALGLHHIEAITLKAGHTHTLFNFPLLAGKIKKISIPQYASYLTDFIIPQETGPLSFFTTYKRFGPSFSYCAQLVAAEDPDLINISCFALAYGDDTVTMAKAIKEVLPCTPIIVGGAGATVFPEFFLNEPAISGVYLGEAETEFPAILQWPAHTNKGQTKELYTSAILPKNIPNLLTRDHLVDHKDKFEHTVKIERSTADILMFIRSPGDSQKKNKNRDKIDYISTSLSRGCPHKCSFCSNYLTHGRQFRLIPKETVIAEIEKLPNPCHINFEDDNILVDKTYFYFILKAIKNHHPKMTFSMENGIDYRFMDTSDVETLINLGITTFNISLGTINAKAMSKEHRRAEKELFEKLLKKIATHKIPVITYFICGLSEDKPDTIVDTLCYLAKLPTLVGISPYYPVPGLPKSPLKSYTANGSTHLMCGSFCYPWNGSMTTQEIITAFRLARLVNLYKKAYPTKTEELLIEKINTDKVLYTLEKCNKNYNVKRISNLNHYMLDRFFSNISK